MKSLTVEEVDGVLGFPVLIKCDLIDETAKDISFIPKENVFLVRVLSRKTKNEGSKTFEYHNKEEAIDYYNSFC